MHNSFCHFILMNQIMLIAICIGKHWNKSEFSLFLLYSHQMVMLKLILVTNLSILMYKFRFSIKLLINIKILDIIFHFKKILN